MSRFQRKGWDDLSDGYRRRLERGGVSRQAYEGGVSLTAARGKASDAQYRADLKDWKDRQRIFYKRKPAEINAAIRPLTKEQVREMLALQKEAEGLFDPRVAQSDRVNTDARRVYERREKTLPEWLFFYHGIYS